MHERLLHKLDQSTLLVVPTGSLVTHLNEVHAKQQIEHGQEVWEAPNIMLWQELLRGYWQQNRTSFSHFHSVLSTQQARLLWVQVVEKSKHTNTELTLLNVQQTVRACMRSHRLLSDWQCDLTALENEHISDVDQFLAWRADYLNVLAQRGVVDEPGLQTQVVEHAASQTGLFSTSKVIWYAYDLVTAAQQTFSDALGKQEIEVVFTGPNQDHSQSRFCVFQNAKQELEAVFQTARTRLEENPEQIINIVIPDLQHRYTQVQEIARQTFYPNASLTDVQANNLVYRFSLGKALHEWPAITTALCALKLLSTHLNSGEIGFLFRSVYLGNIYRDKAAFTSFDRWLRAKRVRQISLARLPALVNEFSEQNESKLLEGEANIEVSPLDEFVTSLLRFKQDLNEQLSQSKLNSGYRTLSFGGWSTVFSDWLQLWGWQTNGAESELSTVAHQLRQRWVNTLEEFASLAVVQRSTGLANAVASFQQLVRDTVFLPKSAMSPLMISGVLEALGREMDVCLLTGMNQDFPPASKNDAFIPNQYLAPTGYPDASPQRSARQAAKVMHSLLGASRESQVSYALSSSNNQDLISQPSPLFQSKLSGEVPLEMADDAQQAPTALEAYTDTHGPAWHAPEKAKGGAAIFKNQSLCAFKAFVTHQLKFNLDQEPEFGLDYLDRGNLAHVMLERLWAQIPSQAALTELADTEQNDLLSTLFDRLLADSVDYLGEDKQRLFAMEKSRIIALTSEWLEVERKRPTDFCVVERESKYQGQWGGIQFEYVIDRIDLTATGQSAIIDYKTGLVSRQDWLGQRPKEPQLPLYALVRDELKSNKVSGIAYAQLRRGDCKMVELADTEIFNLNNHHGRRYQQQWEESREHWPIIFTRLAEEFLAGKADVNPVDKTVCQYCELSAVCRVQELRERSQANTKSGFGGDDD